MAKRGHTKSKTTKIAVKTVEKILLDRSETKHSANTVSTEINTTGTITHLTSINQGTTEITRIGDKITPTSLTIKFCLENKNAGAIFASCVRLMIVRSRIPDRFLVAGDMPSTILSKSDYNKIFVLYDKLMTVTGGDGGGPQAITRKVFIKKKRFLRLTYVAGGNIDLNGVYFYRVGDKAPANADAPDIQAAFDLSFKDV